MRFLRKFALFLSSLGLKICLVLFAFGFALANTLGTPAVIKDSLNKSGIYDKVVDSFIESTSREIDESKDDIPLDDPEVKAAIKKAFSPELLRESTNNFVDGLYGWLNGETEQPEFRVDFTAAKDSVVHDLADIALNRLEKLPACSADQLRNLPERNVNPFTAKCRPPIDLKREKVRFLNEFKRNTRDIKAVITFDDLGPEAKQTFADIEPLRGAVQAANKLPVTLLLVGILLVICIMLLERTKRHGVKKVAVIITWIGVVLGFGIALFYYLFSKANRRGEALNGVVDLGNDGLRNSAVDALMSVLGHLTGTVLKIAVIYIVIGAAVLVWLRVSSKRHTEVVHHQPKADS